MGDKRDLQTGFQLVVDVPDHLWNAAVKGWRETAERQAQMVLQQAGSDRQLARAVTGSLPGRVVSALFQDQRGSSKPEVGPVSLPTVDGRMRETEAYLRSNLNAARVSGYPEAMAGAWPAAAGAWLGKVWPEGLWDDKHFDRRLERQGNFSYGATAAALGLPQAFAQWGAGAAQRGLNAVKAFTGQTPSRSVGLVHSPYGDDPRDAVPILEGHDYAKARVGPKKP